MFNVEPFIGVNDYIFGDNQNITKKKDGKPYKIEIDNIMNITKEIRKGIVLIFIKKRLEEIIIQKTEQANLNGIDIFCDPNVIERLCHIDGNHEKSKDGKYILFRGLGVCLGGFLKKKIPEDKLMIVVSKDRLPFYELFLKV